jgi:hypothetical protein
LAISRYNTPKESNRDMNLDDKKTKPGRFPEATDTTSTPLDDRQNRKTRLGFKATDFVIYPAHVKSKLLPGQAWSSS